MTRTGRQVIRNALALVVLASIAASVSTLARAHGVDDATRAFLDTQAGFRFGPFVYIGAKHMVTGYDHLLFLTGVLFFLHRGRDVFLYVTMFTVGHSLTLLFGVLGNVPANPWIIDAIIGLSVVYKGFDNLGGFRRVFGRQPDTRLAVFVFGLFHGLGLATKLQEFGLAPDGLLANLLAFNLGVELGQLLALLAIVLMLSALRRLRSFATLAVIVNTLLMSAGLVLVVHQLTGYLLSR